MSNPDLLHIVCCTTKGCHNEGQAFSIYGPRSLMHYTCTHCGRKMGVTISDENYARAEEGPSTASQR